MEWYYIVLITIGIVTALMIIIYLFTRSSGEPTNILSRAYHACCDKLAGKDWGI